MCGLDLDGIAAPAALLKNRQLCAQMGLGSNSAALHLQVPAAAVRAATLLHPQIADLRRGRQLCPVSRRVASLTTAADASRWDPDSARESLGPTPQSSAQTVLLPQAAAACPPRHHRPLQRPWQPTAADEGCRILQQACHETGMAGSIRGTWELHRGRLKLPEQGGPAV